VKRTSKVLLALLTVAAGVLLFLYGFEMLSICMTVLGVGLVILAIVDLFRFRVGSALLEGLLGVAVLVIGWKMLDIALFVVAILLGLYGIVQLFLQIVAVCKKKGKGKKRGKKKDAALILGFAEPILAMLASAVLLYCGTGALPLALRVAGVLLVVYGVLSVVAVITGKGKRKKR
jgi:hypothetical protein